MSRYLQKPENSLKRSEELIAVGQHGAALQLLHEIIMSKRSRSTPVAALEQIMLKFIDLCVQMRKGKTAKEGLHQYKNMQQNSNITTIEVVIKKFIGLSEQKVSDAQAKADKIALDAIEDLEAIETPESIILSTVSGEASKDRTDREVVTPWLKFLWEAYRTALDILRNNARLETLYQIVAGQAFGFCLKYTRKTEFRRLCDLLRQHLATATKYAHQTHSINLSEPETLQRHLDTRFIQLSAATELELWQEGFRSIEDIYNLLSMSKKPPKPFMMANYYEKMARILLVGENYLFHAAAWSRYYAIVRQNRNVSEEEHQRMACMVLLSALAVPIIQTGRSKGGVEDTENKEKSQRLANLLRAPKPPTREVLLRDALAKTVLARVRPELRELYNILEVQFHPLSICKKIAPIMQQLQAHSEFSKYVMPIHQIILTRLLQQLSQVYTTIKIESVVKLASFPEPYNLDVHKVEKFIMNGCKKSELFIRIDHRNKSLTFESDVFMTGHKSSSEGPKLSSSPFTQTMGVHLSLFAKKLHTAVLLVDPGKIDTAKKAKVAAFAAAIAHAEAEHQETLKRRALIERKKELREAEQARKEQEEQRQKKMKLLKEQELERQRQGDEQRKREVERIAVQKASIEKEEARKLAEKVADDLGKRKIKVVKEDLESLDADKLMALQFKKLEQERRDLEARLKVIARRNDFIERAFRREEIPLLQKDYEDQKETERAYQEALRQATMDAALRKHTEAMQAKQRMLRMLPDYRQYKLVLEAKRQKEYAELQLKAEADIAAAKEQRALEYAQMKEDERRKREEEEERLKVEAAMREQAAAEEAEREKKQREELEARKAAEAEKLRKLDEIAAKQRQREEEIEAKLAAKEAPSTLSTKYVPPSSREQSSTAPKIGGTPGAWRPGQGRWSSGQQMLRSASTPGQLPTDGERPSSFGRNMERIGSGGGGASNTGPPAGRAPGAGSWRDREAAKGGEGASGSKPPTNPSRSPWTPKAS
ncbi:hypothetical protein SeMB42_g05274 [Synchytrium endobioticum]|uniref:Eukaryotic translation initiation factor 3 subunit A n=1 Tax=Synchytrium endobioticum TaxID=286115 RepID=A0A507CRN8_9FUNG|nr:hypothetical protein SeLEV6574_g05910 [Synchytrium endobioticum]TPX42130.1 hypothetical protein SeMB42_g05274 [Synchytrium endobioticum]